MYAARTCPACKMHRMPEETAVKEGKKHYVVYKCRFCHHQDIERISDALASPPLWDSKWGFKDDAEMGANES